VTWLNFGGLRLGVDEVFDVGHVMLECLFFIICFSFCIAIVIKLEIKYLKGDK